MFAKVDFCKTYNLFTITTYHLFFIYHFTIYHFIYIPIISNDD